MNGFTLKQLLLVVFCFSLLGLILTPGFLRARISANEGAAIGNMRAIADMQRKFVSQLCLDQDHDSQGEFATLGELTGYSLKRGSTQKANPCFVSQKLAPRWGAGMEGIGTASGYYFRIYLPNSGGPAITGLADPKAAPVVKQAAVDLQEKKWIAYGWPIHHSSMGIRSTGIRCFGANEDEEYVAPNHPIGGFITSYSGTETIPLFSAMLNAANTIDAQMNAPVCIGKPCGDNRAVDQQIWNDY